MLNHALASGTTGLDPTDVLVTCTVLGVLVAISVVVSCVVYFLRRKRLPTRNRN